MSQQIADLTEDAVILLNGDKFPCTVGPGLRSTGWRGGIWVRYVTPTNDTDDFVVEASNGAQATGCLVFPSEAYGPGETWGATQNYIGEQFRDDQGSVSGASTVTATSGGGRILFRVYETVAIGPGGLRDGTGGDLTYNLNDQLKISENGFLCNDPDARLALVGIASPLVVGMCCAVPSTRNNFYLGLDLKF